MKSAYWPIRTRQPRIPWIWVGLLSLPWASMLYFEQISNVAITFKAREHVSVPVLLTMIGSLNLFFNVFVGSACSYASDRIWTPMGRRKPFLLAGWAAVVLGCLALPEARSLWVLVLLVFLFEMLRDLATPYESLCNEIVPPGQRGRANAAFTFARQAMIAFFFAVMIGRWDDTLVLPGGAAIRGEQFVFWTGALIALATMAFIHFGVRELPPENPVAPAPAPAADPDNPPAARGGPGAWRAVRGFVHDVFGGRQWLALYAVGIAQMVFWTDFGSLAPLLYTEQWGFSKQAYGNVLSITTVVTLGVFLPLGGWIADRLDRLRLFVVLAALMTLNHLLFYLYLGFIAPADHPTYAAVLIFKLVGACVGTAGVTASVSLMFDYVPRDRLGTVLAGVALTRGLASLLVNNGVGAWVTAMAWLLPRAPGPDGSIRYDYASGYLYLVLCGVASTAIAAWFARQTRSGRLVRLAVLEVEQAPASAPRG